MKVKKAIEKIEEKEEMIDDLVISISALLHNAKTTSESFHISENEVVVLKEKLNEIHQATKDIHCFRQQVFNWFYDEFSWYKHDDLSILIRYLVESYYENRKRKLQWMNCDLKDWPEKSGINKVSFEGVVSKIDD